MVCRYVSAAKDSDTDYNLIEAVSATETVLAVNGASDVALRASAEAGVDPVTTYTRSRIVSGTATAAVAGDIIRTIEFDGCVSPTPPPLLPTTTPPPPPHTHAPATSRARFGRSALLVWPVGCPATTQPCTCFPRSHRDPVALTRSPPSYVPRLLVHLLRRVAGRSGLAAAPT